MASSTIVPFLGLAALVLSSCGSPPTIAGRTGNGERQAMPARDDFPGRFFDDLSCRHAQISAGPHDTGALRFLRNQHQMVLQLFRVDPQGVAAPERHDIAGADFGHGNVMFEYPSGMRLQWTEQGEVLYTVANRATRIFGPEILQSGTPSAAALLPLPQGPFVQMFADLAPEHLGTDILFQTRNDAAQWEAFTYNIETGALGTRWKLEETVDQGDRFRAMTPQGDIILQVMERPDLSHFYISRPWPADVEPYALNIASQPVMLLLARRADGEDMPELLLAQIGDNGSAEAVLRLDPRTQRMATLTEGSIGGFIFFRIKPAFTEPPISRDASRVFRKKPFPDPHSIGSMRWSA